MLEVVTPPVIDDDFLDMVFDHLKVDATHEEAAIADLIVAYTGAAIARVEATSGRMLFARSLRFTADAFGTVLTLPASPVSAVSAVTYVDADGATQTLDGAAYALIDKAETPTLYPSFGNDWPRTRDFPGSVAVTFTAGYGAGVDDVPAPLRMAVMQTVADWYRFGGTVATTALHEIPGSAYQLCRPFRRVWN